MRIILRHVTLLLVALVLAAPAFAQFAPAGPTISGTVGAQTLSAGTGTIAPSGAISIASGGTVPLTMTGVSTLFNNGTIQTLGSGRAIDSNSGSANLTITNTGLISSVSADAFRVNTAGTSVSLVNSGTIRVTAGGQAIDWAAITTGSNSLTNQSGGVISAVGEDAVRPGQNGIVTNAGTITATPTVSAGVATGSDGIDLRTEKVVTVTNTGTITGRHGIATDGANVGPSSLTVNNNAGGVIQALNGSGLNVDANTALPSANLVTANVTNAFGATIKGGALATTLEADGDGIDIDGVLTLTNSGNILGLGAKGGTNNAEGIAAGGGTIINTATGRIIGSTALADAPNGDPTRAGNGILIDDSNGGNAVAATTVTNAGLIQGKNGFGIRMIGTLADSITNSGTIIGGNGTAIDLGGGDDSLTITGGSASIIGNVSGGTGTNTMKFDLGGGNSFGYADSISLFGTVEVKSGLVTLAGANTYTGTTRIDIGGALQLLGMDRLDSLSWLDLNGGLLEVSNAFGINGQTFGSFGLSNSSVIDLDYSMLTFNDLGFIGSGKTLTILDYLSTSSYAFRLLGDYSADYDFLSLLDATTINGVAATFQYDGAFTEVRAVPEPATLILVGLSGALLLALRRRA